MIGMDERERERERESERFKDAINLTWWWWWLILQRWLLYWITHDKETENENETKLFDIKKNRMIKV